MRRSMIGMGKGMGAGMALSLVLLATTPAHADDAADLATAKEAFTRGVDLTRQEKWGEALEAFEVAGRAKHHALTTYNVAVAERALSRYTRARVRFAAAIEEDAASGNKELSQSYRDDAKTFLAELDALLVHANVSIDPADAALMIDGRPLSWTSDERKVAYAGVAAAGGGEKVDRASFELILDPGPHVFTVTKEGFETVARKEDLKAGSRGAKIALSLTAMAGKLRIDANQRGAAVRLDDIDVGLAPILVERPAGEYRVDVRKSGFVEYKTQVNLRPGQHFDLFAKMVEDPPLTKRWWFWTALVGTVAAGVVTAALIVNSNRPYDGGSQGWVAQPR